MCGIAREQMTQRGGARAREADDEDRLLDRSLARGSGCGLCQSVTRSRLREVAAALAVEHAEPERREPGLGGARRPDPLEPVAERRVAEVVEAGFGRDLFEHAVDGRGRRCVAGHARHFQLSKSPSTSTVRASSSGSAVVGTRKNSSAPASRAFVDRLPQRVGTEAGGHRRRTLADLVAEDLQVVVRVRAQLLLRVGTERVPDARREVRRLGAAGVAPRVADLLERGRHRVAVAVERPRAVDADGPARRARDPLRPEHPGDRAAGRPACTGGGPTGSAPSNGGSPFQMRRMVATCSSMRGIATRERRVDRPVVVLAPADADAHREPAVGEHVDRRHLLRDRDRVVGGQDHDRRPEAHPFGERGGRGELHDDVVARVGDPLRDREARPHAPLVDAPAPGEHVGAGVREHGGQRHREVHGSGRYGPLPTTARRDGKRMR